MPTTTYHGSCHCKNVTFEVDADVSKGTSKCNCTHCWKRRAWSIGGLDPSAFRLLSGVEHLSKGELGGFCRECGVTLFGKHDTTSWGGDGWKVSISVAALDDLPPAELVAAPVTYCDGLANNWWHPPAETRHL